MVAGGVREIVVFVQWVRFQMAADSKKVGSTPTSSDTGSPPTTCAFSAFVTAPVARRGPDALILKRGDTFGISPEHNRRKRPVFDASQFGAIFTTLTLAHIDCGGSARAHA
jgi:hypothetical protein